MHWLTPGVETLAFSDDHLVQVRALKQYLIIQTALDHVITILPRQAERNICVILIEPQATVDALQSVS
jgi:hypothetical protein